jgi:hypothetical protein
LKRKGPEQAAWKPFQDPWNDVSKEAMLKQIWGTAPGTIHRASERREVSQKTKGETTMTKQQEQPHVDQLYFDGSAEPNPGGRMGAGWRLVFTDRPQVSDSSE